MKKLTVILLLAFALTASAATKQELLEVIALHCATVDEPQLLQEVGEDHIGRYQVAVLRVAEDSSAVTGIVYFYVANEGEPTEAAYFADRPFIMPEPEPIEPQPEHPTVTALKEFIAPYYGTITEINIEGAWAICHVLLEADTYFEEVNVLVTPDGQGGFNYKRIQ